MRRLLALTVLFLFASCSWPNTRPQKGGGASVGPTSSFVSESGVKRSETASVGSISTLGIPSATISQSENPQSGSGQDVSFESEEETVVPFDTIKTTITEYDDGRKVTVQEPVPAGTKITRRVKQRVEQNLGGSWKDTAREMTAALGSFQGVQYIGIGVFLFGAVAFFNAAIRAIIGGKDVAMAVGAAGLVMMFGPFLFVTYAKWFFLAIVLAGLYWLFARFKYQHGRLDAIESQKQ